MCLDVQPDESWIDDLFLTEEDPDTPLKVQSTKRKKPEECTIEELEMEIMQTEQRVVLQKEREGRTKEARAASNQFNASQLLLTMRPYAQNIRFQGPREKVDWPVASGRRLRMGLQVTLDVHIIWCCAEFSSKQLKMAHRRSSACGTARAFEWAPWSS